MIYQVLISALIKKLQNDVLELREKYITTPTYFRIALKVKISKTKIMKQEKLKGKIIS